MSLAPAWSGWMWVLWLLSQPVERGGLGFDPLSARRLPIEAALFYLASEKETKTRCLLENENSEGPEFRGRLVERMNDQKQKLREHYTGKAELEAW